MKQIKQALEKLGSSLESGEVEKKLTEEEYKVDSIELIRNWLLLEMALCF